jgi:hypothetical protein
MIRYFKVYKNYITLSEKWEQVLEKLEKFLRGP